ncbi:hypothetical protein AK812_SmicGene20274 [Symbiodinium microadriaticum]|uniref:Uncharacterized protein n=1 Tax=Symbiodinium microadriaticum TaxID=2951 RepID=A0A1Q9DQF4_SYMMI|nr:hypothetical protein AK812_SmicGene20274 [Symbiodinium microadriaticum]
MTEKKAVAARVDALESQVRSVACLANATAKGVGKDKVQRQWVAFVQGPCRAKLEEVWAGWKAGASRAKEGGAAAAAAASSETKVVPFKLQVFNLLVEQLAEQGLDQEVLEDLGHTPDEVKAADNLAQNHMDRRTNQEHPLGASSSASEVEVVRFGTYDSFRLMERLEISLRLLAFISLALSRRLISFNSMEHLGCDRLADISEASEILRRWSRLPSSSASPGRVSFAIHLRGFRKFGLRLKAYLQLQGQLVILRWVRSMTATTCRNCVVSSKLRRFAFEKYSEKFW